MDLHVSPSARSIIKQRQLMSLGSIAGVFYTPSSCASAHRPATGSQAQHLNRTGADRPYMA
jgi:hypothetical protein